MAHRKKTLGGGLDELRKLITGYDVDDLLWHEIPKSKKAPKKVRQALKDGAELFFLRITRARKVSVKLRTPTAYELDGGVRDPVTRIMIKAVPHAVTVCLPDTTT